MDSHMRTGILLLLLIAVCLSSSTALQEHHRSELRSIAVGLKESRISVRGNYLGKVEIWAVPSGTGITPDEFTLLGDAKRRTATGENERWIFPYSCSDARLTATEIYAKGFSRNGKQIGKKSLPFVGVSSVYDGLCGPS